MCLERSSVNTPTSKGGEGGSKPVPPAHLSATFVEELDRLNDAELREVISFERTLLNHRAAIPERIEPHAGNDRSTGVTTRSTGRSSDGSMREMADR